MYFFFHRSVLFLFSVFIFFAGADIWGWKSLAAMMMTVRPWVSWDSGDGVLKVHGRYCFSIWSGPVLSSSPFWHNFFFSFATERREHGLFGNGFVVMDWCGFWYGMAELVLIERQRVGLGD
jgi:hypothetical protein